MSPILLRFKALFPWSKKSFYFGDDLTGIVEILAEQNGHTPEEMAGDLIALALVQRAFVEENYYRWQFLTPREQQVAALVCLKYSNRQIGDLLGITQDTVRSHHRKVLSKFNLHTKTGLRKTLSPSSGWDFKAWEEDRFELRSAGRVLTKLIGMYSHPIDNSP